MNRLGNQCQQLENNMSSLADAILKNHEEVNYALQHLHNQVSTYICNILLTDTYIIYLHNQANLCTYIVHVITYTITCNYL